MFTNRLTLRTSPLVWGLVLVALVLVLPATGLAQAATEAAPPATLTAEQYMEREWNSTIKFMIGVVITVVLSLVIVAALFADYLLRKQGGSGFIPSSQNFLTGASALWARFSGMRLSEKAKNRDTNLDHEYDGIIELDNAAPPLFNYILYGSVAYAVIYLMVFHVFEASPLQEEEYRIERATKMASFAAYRARSGEANVTAETVTLSTESSVIARGQQLFMENCQACHGGAGEGKIGPNLTDRFWIHGGGIKNVFVTISEGVQGKMTAWKNSMRGADMAAVANYVLSLQGTNPPNAKGPEGQPEEPAATPATPTDSAVALAGTPNR
jgi:cytochrome c oxidase cbb3-type subunit 3